MKCPECNAFVKAGVDVCPKCGHKLPKAKGAVVGSPPDAKKPGASRKGAPGAKKGGSKIVDMRATGRGPGPMYPPPGSAPEGPKRTVKPTLAAVFLFIVAVQCFVQTIYCIVLIDRDYYHTMLTRMGYTGDIDSYVDLAMNMTLACEILFVIVGIFAIMAGIMAIKRIKWGLCLTGAIVAIFSGGLLFTGTALAITAMILLIVSRHEFAGMDRQDRLPEPEINR